MARYIDPLLDFGFKKIFGSAASKEFLIAFLNEVFEGRKNIVDVKYNQTEHHGDLPNEGFAVYDLLCTDKDGAMFIIEMQRGKQKYFKERALFYTSRLISARRPRTRHKHNKYKLPDVSLIAILEDFALEDSEADEYVQEICLCNRKNGKVFYKKNSQIYIELIKFVKTESELQTDLDKWLYILKNMRTMEEIPPSLQKPIFIRLFKLAEYSNLTEEEKMYYDSRDKHRWDNQNVFDYAIAEAKRVTEIEVAAKTAIEAKAKTTTDIAKKMKKKGYPVTEIAEMTNIQIDEIDKL